EALPPGTMPNQAKARAVLYRGGGITYLGTLRSDDNANYGSSALAINDYGEIVGWSDLGSSVDQRAFISNGVGMSDLTSLINPRNRLAGKVVLTHANAINCNGWIVADGYEVATNKPHGYLLKPQPQPVRADCLNRMAYPDRAPIVPDPAP